MIIQFKDRKKELSELEEVMKSKNFQLFIIYGRRRVGKTELILNATKKAKRLYYLATEENNLDRFYNACVNFDAEAAKLKKDWEVLFDFLKTRTDAIIIDEFQNMIKENQNIISILQSVADVTLKNTAVKLFLLGSSVSIMTSKVLSYKSPLYGRRSGSIGLKPVSFFDLKEFFPEKDSENLVEIYGFADGIPFYLIKISKDFWQWLDHELKQGKTFLKDEADFLVKYEFADSGTYKLILEAIAQGNTKLNEIKNFIRAERTDISQYLKNLIEIGFIKRKVPVTENIKSRTGRYHISDNFLSFWFRFIYPNLSSIEEGIFDTNTIKAAYNTYLGFVFEEVSRQFLIRSKPITFTKIGSWWHKDTEIDIACLDENKKEALFVECKWSRLKEREALQILGELKEKSKHVDYKRKKEYFGIIAKKIQSKEKLRKAGFFAFDLEDFEKILKKK